MEVRDIRPAEYAGGGQVSRAAYEEFHRPGDPDWGGYLAEIADVAGRASRLTVLVAVEGDRILGTVSMETQALNLGDDPIEPETANIRMLGVDPSARGRGVGRALVEGCIRRAQDLGLRAVTLHTSERMQSAQRLYGTMGFARDEARDWRTSEDLILLAYRLDLRNRHN